MAGETTRTSHRFRRKGSLLTPHYTECHEEVIRDDEPQPCDHPAVGYRVDEEGDRYPVCEQHLAFDPHYTDHSVTLYHGDCLDILRQLPDQSVDAVVTDPPYGLEFMGKSWDSFGGRRDEGSRGGTGDKGILPGYGRGGTNADVVRFKARGATAFQQWCELWATECLRVLKPGGHMLAFGGTRTFHRLACAVEDAGFEIRDSIAWLYGSGFPKSLDVSKAIDKAAGAEREIVGSKLGQPGYSDTATTGRMLPTLTTGGGPGYLDVTAPATDAARQWQGWGTALKPAFEPIVVARKPLIGTVAANVTAWGTGALNVDACRIGTNGGGNACPGGDLCACVTSGVTYSPTKHPVRREGEFGRWPANVILDETQAAALDQQSGDTISQGGIRRSERRDDSWGMGPPDVKPGFGDSGGASRFYYTAKAPTTERSRVNGIAHPTTKPLTLMRWLVRLVTPPGGTVLEPFAGSGTTVEACILEGFHCIAIEREAEYLPLIVQRVNRQRDPIAYTATAGEDLGLFGFEDLA